MITLLHINEINDHKPSHVSQSELSGNLSCGLKIGLIDHALNILPNFPTTRIHVNGNQCLCGVDDD